MSGKPMLAFVLVLAASHDAGAQPFPDDSDWFPLLCDGAPMQDRFEDEAGALDDRDLVGDVRSPAGFHGSDVDFLYLRLRLDEDPLPGGTPRPAAWGVQLDLDANLATYELLIVADGIGTPEVALYRNRTTTVANSPSDPADLPAVATFPLATHARSLVASRTRFGNTDDFFLDIAVPWSALVPLGLDHGTRTSVWAGSSSIDTALNGDLACHDGSTGEPALDQVATDPTAGDPVVDSDGDGFTDAEEIEAGTDPNDPNSLPPSRLEGGGGCAAGGKLPAWPLALALVLPWLMCRRFRSRGRVRSYDGGR